MNYVVGWGDFNVPILLKHTLCAESGVSSTCSYKNKEPTCFRKLSFVRLNVFKLFSYRSDIKCVRQQDHQYFTG